MVLLMRIEPQVCLQATQQAELVRLSRLQGPDYGVVYVQELRIKNLSYRIYKFVLLIYKLSITIFHMPEVSVAYSHQVDVHYGNRIII